MMQTVYIVQKLHWEWNDEAYVVQDDSPVKAFLLRDDAQKYRDVLERAERKLWDDEKLSQRRSDATPFYEVVSIGVMP